MNRWIRHGGMYPNYHLRLFRKRLGACEYKAYDQHFIVDGKIKKLPLGIDMIDDNGSDLIDFMAKHTRWSVKEADESFRSVTIKGEVKEKANGNVIERKRFLKNRIYSRLPVLGRPILFFLFRYVFRLGFLDGRAGYIIVQKRLR